MITKVSAIPLGPENVQRPRRPKHTPSTSQEATIGSIVNHSVNYDNGIAMYLNGVIMNGEIMISWSGKTFYKWDKGDNHN